jgi:uncharacterized alkaline shock family protein YloU
MSITEQVIASIAGIAAAGVEGLAGMRGNVTDDLAAILGEDRQGKGVLTQRQDGSVHISLHVIVKYGYPIYRVARQLQARVKAEVEEMTGLIVSAVDVYVQALQLPQEGELK